MTVGLDGDGAGKSAINSWPVGGAGSPFRCGRGANSRSLTSDTSHIHTHTYIHTYIRRRETHTRKTKENEHGDDLGEMS